MRVWLLKVGLGNYSGLPFTLFLRCKKGQERSSGIRRAI